jgi:hypothetical protein
MKIMKSTSQRFNDKELIEYFVSEDPTPFPKMLEQSAVLKTTAPEHAHTVMSNYNSTIIKKANVV